MMPDPTPEKSKPLPWWTWIAPLLLIEVGDQLSLLFRYSESYSAFYLPTCVALVLIHWWGPARVLPYLFMIGSLNSWFYGTQTLWLWPIFGFIETTTVFLSWFLFTYKLKGEAGLPNTKQTIQFLTLGLIIPLLFEVSLWEITYIWDGTFPSSMYWEKFSRDMLSELIVNFSITLPVLFFLTPRMSRLNLLSNSFLLPSPTVQMHQQNRIEIFLIFIAFLLVTFVLPFERFWFVYGLLSLYLAIRFGFGMALLGNAYLFFISYLVPALVQNLWLKQNFVVNATLTNTFLGSLLLYLFATITGRVITDMKIIEEKLHQQNVELKETNQELDRFVYSVSHDLSAPLKSIQGLVNISQLDNSSEHKNEYLTKIGQSVSKLDLFIKEILDYSRNKRISIQNEPIQLKPLCEEIIENLKYMDNFQVMKFDLDTIKDVTLISDRLRLKMILTNIFSNAIKFQKKIGDEIPYLRVVFTKESNIQKITVSDNGEGIKPEFLKKIFDMFFRGHSYSHGSGLGLYIAKESVEKIGGRISVDSEFGRGSAFTIEIPMTS